MSRARVLVEFACRGYFGWNLNDAPQKGTSPRPGNNPAPTGELIERWRRGDLAAREELVLRSLPHLRQKAQAFSRGLGRACGANPTELIQETWLRALASLPATFEERKAGALSGYLWRILQRTVLDRYRSARRRKRDANEIHANGDEEKEQPLDAMPDPKSHSPTSQARAAEWLALVQSLLSEREWELWRKVEVEGHSIAEAARARGESESAARGVLHRARARLLERLCDDEA